jgi:hypothetical protein
LVIMPAGSNSPADPGELRFRDDVIRNPDEQGAIRTLREG